MNFILFAICLELLERVSIPIIGMIENRSQQRVYLILKE